MLKDFIHFYMPLFLVANQNLNPSSYLLSPILWIVVNLFLMFFSSRWTILCNEEGLSPCRLEFLSRQIVYRAAWNTYWRVNFGTLRCGVAEMSCRTHAISLYNTLLGILLWVSSILLQRINIRRISALSFLPVCDRTHTLD